MSNRRIAMGGLAVLGLVLGTAAKANAQYGALQRVLFRGTEFAGEPLFLSNPQGGPLQEFNQFFQRVEFNRLGDGFTYEFFRFFGSDTFGNSETFDLGPLKVQLSPDPALGQTQLTGLHGRTGFTTRFIPEIFFQAETGQRSINQLSGVIAFTQEPIRYNVTFNAGIQDFEWSGNIKIVSDARINALGFYDFSLELTNIGDFQADGVFLQDEQVTDFDTGTIDLSGHIVMDAIAGLLQGNGNPDTAAVPRIFSAAAQKERTADELLIAIEEGEKLTDAEVKFLIEQMFATAFLNDPLGFVMNGLPQEVPGFEALSLAVAEDPQETGPGSLSAGSVPEPGTLVLLGLGGVAVAVVRPRARRRRRTA